MDLKINTASGSISGLLDCNALKDKLFFVALLLVAIVVFVPFAPNMPHDGLDPSWMYGLNEAVAQGMAFGKDIVFTFGPYASIYTKTYHPATYHLMIWGSLYLAVSFSVAAYLNFKLTGWPLKIALLTVLGANLSRDALFFFYPMLVGVHVYRWAISSSFNKSPDWNDVSLTIILFAPFGLFPLIKGSALFACVAIYILSIALLAKRGQWKLCLLIGATPLISIMIFWTLSGQSLPGLADYFVGLSPIISGYTEAMATNGDPKEYLLYMVATAVLVGVLLRETRGSVYDTFVVVLIFLCVLFLAFKAGFVRHDGHAIISGTMILLGGILAITLLTFRNSLTVLMFSCTIAGVYINASHIKTIAYNIVKDLNISTQEISNIKENFNIRNIYSIAWTRLKQKSINPESLANDYDESLNELSTRGSIPKLKGSVDIYSYDQSYLIASGNNWNPRPIFQSYSVYTSKLAELNKMHLIGENRPDNIIFKVQPIDGRLPSIEDGASWPVLLSNYEPASFMGGYLFLKNRDSSSHSYEEPKKIGEGVYSFGEQIILPNSDAPLFAKVNIRKSFAGSIMSALFKPSQLAIQLTMHNGVVRHYRIIAGMTESGFLVSPLIENTEELGVLFSDANYLDHKKVKSIEIFATSLPFLWEKSFKVSFYELDFKPTPDFFGKMGIAKPITRSFEKITLVQRCDGSIDGVNSASPALGLIRTSSLLKIHGWLAASVDPAEVPENVYLILSDLEGKRYFIDTERTQRPDVGAYFNKPVLNFSGYTSVADVSNLNGDYYLGLAYSREKELFICTQFNFPVKIGNL